MLYAQTVIAPCDIRTPRGFAFMSQRRVLGVIARLILRVATRDSNVPVADVALFHVVITVNPDSGCQIKGVTFGGMPFNSARGCCHTTFQSQTITFFLGHLV